MLTRRSFCQTVGCVGGALALGHLPGCGDGGPSLLTVTPVDGKATLPFAQFPQLVMVGGGVVVKAGDKPIVVMRTSDTAAGAVSAICTHEGCTVTYTSGANPIDCHCHNSIFSSSGAPVSGPARGALASYVATLNADNVVVTL